MVVTMMVVVAMPAMMAGRRRMPSMGTRTARSGKCAHRRRSDQKTCQESLHGPAPFMLTLFGENNAGLYAISMHDAMLFSQNVRLRSLP
jgi:hypothetical protein